MNVDQVRQTIATVQTGIQDMERQLAEQKKVANGLCKLIGDPPAYAEVEPSSSQSNFGIQSDSYFCRPLATAVKDILERRKAAGLGAAPLDAIYDLMRLGGFRFDAKNDATAKRALAIALSKNPAFIRLPNDDIGLIEWYPDARAKAPTTAKKKPKGAAVNEEVEEDDFVQNFPDRGSDLSVLNGEHGTASRTRK